MKAPRFWQRRGIVSMSLYPLSLFYAAAGWMRSAFFPPFKAPVPVLCIGNSVAGGAGKTPAVISLVRFLKTRGYHPHILAYGYGGCLKGPRRVESRHTYHQVGDEAILLARYAPTWIGSNRALAAKAAVAAGADILVMDDGLQNPHLHKDWGLLVIDGSYGLGNGCVIPAGPLREPLSRSLARSHAALIMGKNPALISFFKKQGKKTATGTLHPNLKTLKGQKIIAFAGIGRPQKFYDTLKSLEAHPLATYDFSDHHPYEPRDLEPLIRQAKQYKARLYTTEKDFVRVPENLRPHIKTLPVELAANPGWNVLLKDIL